MRLYWPYFEVIRYMVYIYQHFSNRIYGKQWLGQTTLDGLLQQPLISIVNVSTIINTYIYTMLSSFKLYTAEYFQSQFIYFQTFIQPLLFASNLVPPKFNYNNKTPQLKYLYRYTCTCHNAHSPLLYQNSSYQLAWIVVKQQDKQLSDPNGPLVFHHSSQNQSRC